MERVPDMNARLRPSIPPTPFEENQTNEEEREIKVQFPVHSSSPEITTYEPHTNSYIIPQLEAIASAIVLEEAADQLAILGRIGDLPAVHKNLEYKNLADRFDVCHGDSRVFDPETIEPYEVALDKQKFVKFQTDRYFLEKVLRETINGLMKNGNYKYLVNQLNQHDQKFYEENQLLDKQLENETKLNDIHNLLESERRQFFKEIQQSSEIIGNLKDQFQDTLKENKIKKVYIENWENSRMEQNSFTLDKEEEFYLNIINGIKLEIERETRIDAEIENFIRETQRQYEEDIQTWMDKYDREIELRDTEIQVLKEKREEQFARLQSMSILYKKHRDEIDQYLEVKEQRRIEAEILANRHKAATRIQAWWRGLMVRKGFGPFRKKRGKKDKDSGKKKGKK